MREQLSGKATNAMVRLIDSSTIDLNLNQFEWAQFRSTKAGIKLHPVYGPHAQVPVYFDYSCYYSLDQQGSVFVARMKTNACYEVIEEWAIQGEGIVSDKLIRLSGIKAQKDCPIRLRRITFNRSEDQKQRVFLTNDLKRLAEDIAALYKQRWQIEWFFKVDKAEPKNKALHRAQ